jgi:ankyrin repeat protein
LQYAVKLGKDDIAKYLIETGADINQYDKYGVCALDEAVKRGNTTLVNLLISSGYVIL